jgi:hypothetical protein
MVIRFLVQTWVEHFEKYGVAALPPNWERLIDEMDGRTKLSRANSEDAAVIATALIPAAKQQAALNEEPVSKPKIVVGPPIPGKPLPKPAFYRGTKPRLRQKNQDS